MAFRKGGFPFEDNFNAIMALINADMLEYDKDMLSEMNSNLENKSFVKKPD